MIKYKIYEPEDNPFDLLLADITHRCNMECANCYIPNRHITDMDVDKLYKFLACNESFHIERALIIFLIAVDLLIFNDIYFYGFLK